MYDNSSDSLKQVWKKQIADTFKVSKRNWAHAWFVAKHNDP